MVPCSNNTDKFQTWALLYHSVFGLLFLVSACFLWALRNSRKWSFTLSPLLLFYAEFLLVAQYVYSMNLPELEPSGGGVERWDAVTILRTVGFIRPTDAVQAMITLAVKVSGVGWVLQESTGVLEGIGTCNPLDRFPTRLDAPAVSFFILPFPSS